MTEGYASLITQFPIFRGFTEQGAEMLLDSGCIRDLDAGELLFSEGDSAASVLLVLTGRLQVFVSREGRDLVLTDTGPGTILGEIAVLSGIPRSASVRAAEPSACLEFSESVFRTLLLRNTFLSQRVFAQALRTLIEKEQELIRELTSDENLPQRG